MTSEPRYDCDGSRAILMDSDQSDPPKPTGRPRVWDPTPEHARLIEELAGIQCTMAEIAAMLHVSLRTLERRVRDDPMLSDALEQGRERGKVSLRRKLWKYAENEEHRDGGRVAIWLSKQALGMRDTQHLDHTSDGKPLEAVRIYVPDNGRTPT